MAKPSYQTAKLPTLPFSKPKFHFFSSFSYAQPIDVFVLCLAIVLIITSSACLPTLAWLCSSFIQLFSDWEGLDGNYDMLQFLLTSVSISGISLPILFYISRALLFMFSRRIVFLLRQKHTDALLADTLYGIEYSRELHIKLEEDYSTLLDALGPQLATCLWATASIFSSILFSFLVSWQLTALSLILIPFMVIGFRLFRQTLDSNSSFSEKYTAADSVVREVLKNIKVVVSLGGEYKELERYQAKLSEIESTVGSTYLWQAFALGGTSYLFYGAFAAILYVGILFLKNLQNTQAVTPFHFAGIIYVSFCACICISVMHFIPSCLNAFPKAQAALNRLLPVIETNPLNLQEHLANESFSEAAILKSEDMSTANKSKSQKRRTFYTSNITKENLNEYFENNAPQSRDEEDRQELIGLLFDAENEFAEGKIRFQDIDLKNQRRLGQPYLDNFNLEIKLKTTVAVLVKDEDAQKWTRSFFKLIQNIKKPEKGVITLNGNNLRGKSQDWMRANIMEISDEPLIFPTSLRENLTFGKLGYSEQEISARIDAIDINGFLTFVKLKLETIPSLEETELEPQEKIAIGIIRAALVNPNVLLINGKIFEGPDSQKLAKIVHTLCKDKTAIIVCQAMRSVRGVDKVMVVERGVAEEVPSGITETNLNGYKSWVFESDKKEGSASPIKRSMSNSVRSSTSLQIKIDSSQADEEAPFIERINSMDLKELNDALGFYEDSFAANTKPEVPDESHEKLWRQIHVKGSEFLWGFLAILINSALVPVLCTLCGRFLVSLLTHSNIIDTRKIDKELTEIFFIAALIFGFYLLGFSKMMWYRLLAANALRKETFAKILRMHMGWHDDPKNSIEKMALGLRDDVNKTSAVISINQSVLIQIILSLSVAILMSLLADAELGLATLGIIIIMTLVFAFTEVFKLGYKKEYQDYALKTSHFIATALSDITTVQRLKNKQQFFTYLNKLTHKSIAIQRNISICTDIFSSLSIFALFANMGIMFSYGLTLHLTGELTLENLVVCLVVPLFTILELIKFRFLMGDPAEITESSEEIYKYFEARSEIDIEDRTLKYKGPIEGQIEFKNVVFRYPGQKTPILKGLSFRADAGKMLVITGDANSGKEAIGQLLLRLYDVESGDILVDQVNIKSYNLHHLRKKIGVAFGESQLFEDTVEKNINYIELHMPLLEIKEAAKKADQLRMGDNMPISKSEVKDEETFDKENEISRILAMKSTELSHSQKHRVTIARTLLRRPRVFVLEGLKGRGGFQGVLENLKSAVEGGTKILITDYDDAENENYDVIVMKNGQAMEIRQKDSIEKDINLLDE